MRSFRRSKLIALSALILAAVCNQAGCAAAGRVLSNGVAQQREKWRASGVRDYRMRAVIQKTGHATPMGTFEVRVRGGRVESVLAAGSPMGDVIPVPERPLSKEYIRDSRFEQYGTVESFFDQIEKAEKGSPDVIKTEYHPTLGYPTYLHLDPSRSVRDDELMVRVLEVEPLGQ